MRDFLFEVNLIAEVRVRASDETVARKIVPTALRAPSGAEIKLANEGNVFFTNSIVTGVQFVIEGNAAEMVSAFGEASGAARPSRPRKQGRLQGRSAPASVHPQPEGMQSCRQNQKGAGQKRGSAKSVRTERMSRR